MKIIPAIIGSVSTLAVCAGAGVGIGMATNENFKNDVYTTIGVVSEQKYEETQTQLQEELEKISELQSDKAELENKIATIKNEKDDIASSLLTKESELETLTNTYNELVESNNAATAQLETLASEIETKKTEIANLQAQYDECSAHLSGAYADISALNNQIASLQSQLESMQNANVTLEHGTITFTESFYGFVGFLEPATKNNCTVINTYDRSCLDGFGIKTVYGEFINSPLIEHLYSGNKYRVQIGNAVCFVDDHFYECYSDDNTVVSVRCVNENNESITLDSLVDDKYYFLTWSLDYTVNEESGYLDHVSITFSFSENV